jgi:hypothetical protein
MAGSEIATAAEAPDNADGRHAVGTRLGAKGISRVVVVDDYFDPPSRAEFVRGEFDEFWAELTDAGLVADLSELVGVDIVDEDDVTDAVIESLYRRRNELGSVEATYLRTIGSTLAENHAGLDGFVTYLEAELGLDVRCFGSKGGVDTSDAQVLFVDYYLGPDRDKAAVATATEAVREVMNGYDPGESKPLVVLMSSDPNVQESADEFRNHTEIIGGMFYFVPKDDLTDRVKLFLNLDMLAAALPVGHDLQQVVDAIQAKLLTVSGEFLAAVRRLNLDDYVYIQRLSLQKEGHPLGDYLFWLFNAYLGHLLFEKALGAHRRRLDKLSFKEWIPSHGVPSAQLAAIYQSAVFDTTVDPLSAHPRWSLPTDAPASALGAEHRPERAGEPLASRVVGPDGRVRRRDMPMLNLGDVFLNSEQLQVLMVANPECDLQFAPDGTRLPYEDDAIVLIPGTLETLDQPLKGTVGPRTDLFVHDEQQYRIVWAPKRVQAIEYGKIADVMERTGFERVARLRLPFALEVQWSFASGLTRVGVPVPPPFFRSLRSTLYQRSEDGNHEKVMLPKGDAEVFLVDSKESPRCVLTTGMVRALQGYMSEMAHRGVEVSPGENAKRSGATRAARRERRKEAAVRSSENYEAWEVVAQPFPLPKPGGKQAFPDASVVIGHAVDVTGTWTHAEVLLLHIAEIGPEQDGTNDIDRDVTAPDSGGPDTASAPALTEAPPAGEAAEARPSNAALIPEAETGPGSIDSKEEDG